MDYFKRLLIRLRKFEEANLVLNLFNKGVLTAGTMIDVGAHHGSSLVSFAQRRWKIYAFEPDRRNREALIRNVSAYKNVTIDSRAVSNTSGQTVPIYCSAESSGISSLYPFHVSHHPADEVITISLADAVKEYKIDNIDFLKIDTEGYDYFVLQGLNWDHFTPKVIMCEYENAKSEGLGYNFHDLCTFLDDKGYQIIVSEWYPVKKYGVIHKWRTFQEFPCALKDPKSWGNLIAIHDTDMYDKLLALASRAKQRYRVRRAIYDAFRFLDTDRHYS